MRGFIRFKQFFNFYLLRIIALVIAFLSLTGSSHAEEVQKDTVKIGSYIISMHDIDFRNKEYTLRFWLWMLYKNKDFDFANRVEVPNAKSLEKPDVFIDSTDHKNWVLLKMKCVMKQAWKVNDFPFDKQKLKLKIENSAFDNQSLIFTADTAGEHADPELAIDGWRMTNIESTTTTSIYNTAFGDSRFAKPYSEYDCYEVHFDLERNAWGLFLKIFLGMYVAFMIGYISFFIHPAHVEASFGLQVGGLFAAVGNKYIIDSSLPETTSFTLVDTLHATTFVYLFLIIFSCVISLSYYKHRNLVSYINVNRYSYIVILLSYIVFNIFFILSAIHDFGIF